MSAVQPLTMGSMGSPTQALGRTFAGIGSHFWPFVEIVGGFGLTVVVMYIFAVWLDRKVRRKKWAEMMAHKRSASPD